MCWTGASGRARREETMNEAQLRELIAAAKAGRVSRRAVVRRMVGLGLTAPFASLMLAHAGVAAEPAKSDYKPTKAGGGGPILNHPFSADSAWNKLIDPARITYTDSTTIENQQFRDLALANAWVHNLDILFQTPFNAPVKIWQYDGFLDNGVFTQGGTL